MKKAVSIILCLVLVLSMLLTMTGCGEQSKFIGKWRGEIDLADMINEQFAADETMSQYLNIDSFEFSFTFEFKDDGTYSQSLDEDSLEDAMDDFIDDVVDGMEDYMDDEAKKLGLTTSDVLSASGYNSVREMVEESYSETSFEEITGELNNEGNFKVADGKLYLSDGKDYAIDEEQYYTYEITEDKIVLKETFIEDEQDLKDLFPWTLEKIS